MRDEHAANRGHAAARHDATGSDFLPHPSSFILSVHLFARARELAGSDAVAIELPTGASVADLRRELAARFPALAALLAASALAVNHDFAEGECILSPRDEVAVIPPVSGG